MLDSIYIYIYDIYISYLYIIDSRALFLESLKQANISRPEQSILQTIFLRFAKQVELVRSSVDDSAELYRQVKDMPKTSTKCALVEKKIDVNGPVPELDSPQFLSATGPNGQQLMVKVLRPFRELMSQKDAKSEFEMEEKAAERFWKVQIFCPYGG